MRNQFYTFRFSFTHFISGVKGYNAVNRLRWSFISSDWYFICDNILRLFSVTSEAMVCVSGIRQKPRRFFSVVCVSLRTLSIGYPVGIPPVPLSTPVPCLPPICPVEKFFDFSILEILINRALCKICNLDVKYLEIPLQRLYI